VALPVPETIWAASQRVSSELWLAGWAAQSSHSEAGRFAARFRVGTRLLLDLVLSEDKTAEALG
jgi:hypothetical protein